MAGLTVYNGGYTGGLGLPSSYQLQPASTAPTATSGLQASPSNLQPAINVTAPNAVLGASTYATPAAPSAPPAPTAYYDTFGNSYSTPTAAAAANQSISQTNAALGRLPNQLNVGLGNIDTGYNTALNQLTQTKANTDQSYNTSKNQATQDFVTTKDTIGSNAGSSLSGLLRLLGSRGAGGSSAALYSAPTAVGTAAAQQRAGAGQTFGRNEQALDTNYNQFLDQYGNSLTNLGQQKDNSRNSLQAQIDTTRAGLLNTLAGLQSSPSSAQPYLNQENSLLSQADSLGAQVPVFQVAPTTYNAPSLDSYTANPFAAPQVSQNAQTDATSPYLTSLLLAGQKDKQNNLGAF